jgi:hypothetical protein
MGKGSRLNFQYVPYVIFYIVLFAMIRLGFDLWLENRAPWPAVFEGAAMGLALALVQIYVVMPIRKRAEQEAARASADRVRGRFH